CELFRIFGKLEQNDGQINPAGIGLGLTICNNILKQMNSHLMVESTFGQGSTFSFVVRLAQKRIMDDELTLYDVGSSINYESLGSYAIQPYFFIDNASITQLNRL